MKRNYAIALISILALCSSCGKCYNCTRDPGHGAPVEEQQFCGTEADDQQALGWTCK